MWTFQALDGWPDAFLLFPFAAVGVGSLVQFVVDRAPGKVALASTLAVATACTATAVSFSVGKHDDRLEEQRRSTDDGDAGAARRTDLLGASRRSRSS